MSDLELIAAGLTKAQAKALYPGPGNPEYARGPTSSMAALERLGLVHQVNLYSMSGQRSGLLTTLGASVRQVLAAATPNA